MMLLALWAVLGATDGGQAAARAAVEKKLWDEALKSFLPDGGRLPGPAFKWGLRNVIEDIEMPGVQESNGIPVKLHAVRVKNNLRGVLEEVVGLFERGGLYVQPLEQQPQITAETVVTGLDSERFISYTAIIRCQSRDACTVVLGEANIGLAATLKQLNKARNMFAPAPPGARGITTTSVEGMQTLSFSVSLGEAELKQWYATELPKLGYQPLSEGRFKRGSDLVHLSTRRHEGNVIGLLVRRTLQPGDE